MKRWVVSMAIALTATGALAAVQVEPVEYAAGGTKLKGYVAVDTATTGKRPAVLVVHEWWGCNDYAKKRAAMLAELGYVGFALDMFGDGRVTTSTAQAAKWAGEIRANPRLARERFEAAMAKVKYHPLTDPDRVAAIGYCFGGSVCLDMARAGLPLAGVASFHGTLSTTAPATAGSVKARILVLHGDADPMVPDAQVKALEAEMKAAGADLKVVRYPGAVHSFTNPDAGKAGIEGVAYNEAADKASWEELKAFLHSVFAAHP
ncbi:MAG: dienelactone hydrolase family protein [Candidatus Sumerlaeaceae bacterium]|nr:dienelactone hydrolase family protein [Candidatus Sumerlaeaceae bacterium]